MITFTKTKTIFLCYSIFLMELACFNTYTFFNEDDLKNSDVISILRNQGRAYESRVGSGSISVMRWALFHMGWHKRRVCSPIHAFLTNSTLDHAQRISIDPGKAVVEDCRE